MFAAVALVAAACTSPAPVARGPSASARVSTAPPPTPSPTPLETPSLACRSAYATLVLLGWGSLRSVTSTLDCAKALMEVRIDGPRALLPAGWPTSPRVRAPRAVSCGPARKVLARFGAFPGRFDCAEARYVASMLPVTRCPVEGMPALRTVILGSGAAGWQDFEDRVTSAWVDDEAGAAVQVRAGAPAYDPSRGEIVVSILHSCTLSAMATRPFAVEGYRGGTYEAPRGVGPTTLVAVTGTLTDHDLFISFRFPGGTGTLDPLTARFVIHRG